MWRGAEIDRNADAIRDRQLADTLRSVLSRAAGRSTRVLLAVSGGPDSTALMHVAVRLGDATTFHVATVDHGLRAESGREAVAVGALARRLGLSHRILVWADPKRESALQEAARAARYRLLVGHAEEIDAGLVLTAHTADDQAETILMRLIAGSGMTGLAGMRSERALSERVRLVRPFMSVRKAELVDYCERHGLPFLHDPSNTNAAFARARLRRLLPLLEREGMTTERLLRLGERAARDDAALSRLADHVFAEARRSTEAGILVLDGWRLSTEPEAIVLRVVDRAIDATRSQAAEPVARRLERTERIVLDALLPALGAGTRLRRTLREVVIECTPRGDVRFAPAPPRRKAKEPSGTLAAARPDLLGKEEAADYIGVERVE